MNVQKIAVLGAGTMGAGMAAVYAANGYETGLYSRTEETLEKARRVIGNALRLMQEERLCAPFSVPEALARLHCTTRVEEAVEGAFYVVETVSEKREVKEALYRRLAELMPEGTLLSSNTSYMNIFPLVPERRQETTYIAHWAAPPHILPLVELVKGPGSRPEGAETLMRLHEACGKQPVLLERFISGFILNRMQAAMTREVMGLLAGGYASAEMIDRAVKASLMPRGLLLGVVQRMDFTGLDQMTNSLQGEFVPFDRPPADNPVSAMAARGELGAKSGLGFYDYRDREPAEVLDRRDRQLIRSLRLVQELEADPLGRSRE